MLAFAHISTDPTTTKGDSKMVLEKAKMTVAGTVTTTGSTGRHLVNLGVALTRKSGCRLTMGGAMGFTSTPGEGSTFWIDFPVAEEKNTKEP